VVISFLYNVIVKLIGAFTVLLPSGSAIGANSVIQSFLQSSLYGHVAWLNYYFPVSFAAELVNLILAFMLVMWTVNLLLWTIGFVSPGGKSVD